MTRPVREDAGWRPGETGMALLGLVLLLLGLSGWFPMLADAAWWLFLLTGAASLVEAWRLRRMPAPVLTRQAPAIVPRGEAFPVSLRLENPTALSLSLRLRESLPVTALPAFWETRLPLPKHGIATAAYALTLPRRGRHLAGPAWAFVAGPWRLVERRLRLDEGTVVKSYPESLARPEGFRAAMLSSQADQRARSRQRGEGMEFDALGEYRPGDDPRHVDWKASVRARQLMVRRHQRELHRQVMVCLDCGRLMGIDAGQGSKLDRAVDAGLALCRTALAHGDRCGVALFDSRLHGFLPPQAGPRAWEAIVATAHDAASEFQETDFEVLFTALQTRQRKRCLVVVLSDLADEATSAKTSAGLLALARRHVVVFAALRTPRLSAYLEEPLRTEKDVARKAVALHLMRDREAALHALTRAGVQVLDVAPREVTTPLINRYVEIRRGNRL